MDSKPPATPGPPQATDLNALAQIAGGIAPALNDLLTVVTGRAGLLLDHGDPDPQTREALNQIYTAGEQAVGLIRQLLLFSGRETPHVQVLDLNNLITEAGDVLRRVAGAAVAVEFRLATGLPPVPADASMVEQILLGLASNARDAMPQGGQLIVTTTRVDIAETEVSGFPGGRAGSYVVLRVGDSGTGIPAEIRPHIFRPFFTTKTAGRHAGLGLAAILGIVRQHQGWLAVESDEGGGTMIDVFLPAAEPGAVLAAGGPSATRSARGRETVLLVEDELTVREFTAALLQRDGYRVLQADSAKTALEVWKWHSARIALLLTDMVLVDSTTGLDLARKLRAEKPGLPVICMSGHGREIMGRSIEVPAGCQFLQKPCRPQELARTVRALLDGKIP